jgi:opacity protein-like surface antigen
MKKILLGAIAFFAVSANAGAADLPVKAPVPYAAYDWTGLYVGAHAGWENADTAGFTNNMVFSTVAPQLLPDNSVTDQTMRGWLGGGQFGYNHQFGRAVMGVEFSGSWSNLKSHSVGTVNAMLSSNGLNSQAALGCAQLVNLFTPAVSVSTSLACDAKVDWTVQALTRLGYTFGDGRFLPYVVAGVALTRLSIATSINFNLCFPSGSQPCGSQSDVFGKSRDVAGVVLGGGAQYALGNGFSVGLEYLYARYPSQDFSSIGTFSCSGAACGGLPNFLHAAQENRDLTTNTVRAVLNYKFAN